MKLRLNRKVKVPEVAEDFMLLKSDPKHREPPRPNTVDRGKQRKSLTKRKKWSILKRVNKKLKERTNKMSKEKTQKSNGGILKCVAWLVFALQQAFVGYVLLNNFDNYFVVAAGIASLAIAGAVVVAHFVKAHK